MAREANCGVYKITNMLNDKVYVGSSVNMKRRQYIHFWLLRRGRHDNIHLQRAYNKDGENNFNFEVIEHVRYVSDRDKLLQTLLSREQFWINELKVIQGGFGYNICPIAGTSAKKEVSQETRDKLSKIKKGIYPLGHLSEEARKEAHRRQGEAVRGHKVDEQTREKIRATLKGSVPWIKGKKHTDETRKKISKSHEKRTSYAGYKFSEDEISFIKEDYNKTQKCKETLVNFNLRYGRAVKDSKTIQKVLRDNGAELFNYNHKKKVTNLNTGEIFVSLTSAAEAYNISISSLSVACRGIKKLVKGCEWRYVDT